MFWCFTIQDLIQALPLQINIRKFLGSQIAYSTKQYSTIIDYSHHLNLQQFVCHLNKCTISKIDRKNPYYSCGTSITRLACGMCAAMILKPATKSRTLLQLRFIKATVNFVVYARVNELASCPCSQAPS